MVVELRVGQLLLLATMIYLPSGAAATPSPPAGEKDCMPATALAVSAQQICSGTPIGTALLS
eukprot:SAG31_NODE_19085_length_612_cov_1.243665_1_plen_61_part_10